MPEPFVARGSFDQRSVILGATGAAVAFALAHLSLTLSRFDGALATIWLPNAFAVAFLLRARLANELTFYAANLVAGFAANALNDNLLEVALGYSVANIAGVIVVVGLTRRRCGPRPDMNELASLVHFFWIGGFLGPLVSACLAAMAIAQSTGTGGMFEGALGWFLTESMGMILIVPTALLLSEAWLRQRRPSPALLAEGTALLACSFLCIALVFGQNTYPLLFLIFPMTLVHAFRLGGAGSALHIALLAAGSTIMTWRGLGPIAQTSASPAEQLHLVQTFIAANLLTSLPICAILAGRERLAKALGERQRELALLANSITDAVLRLDDDGVCTYASPAVREVLGEEPEALIGRPIDALTQEDASQRITEVVRRLLDGESEKERLTYRRQLDDTEGEPVFIEADCAIAQDPVTGRNRGVILSARDVTERVELELLLTRARRHAEKAAGAKSDFLANMSHEIRTPMNGVLGFAELMLQGELDPEQRRHTEMIVESGRSMMLLLNDILDLSKIEAGEIMIDTGPIDLHATLEECIALHRPHAKKKGLALRLDYALDEHGLWQSDPGASTPNMAPTVITDGLRLRQIALNLIGNAVKFTEGGEVEVSYWASDDELNVRVQDTGIGISPGRQEKIFRPFTQGDKGTARRFGGTGLGLSISRQLAELLGGRITVDSTPGVGSTFTLTLPTTIIEPSQAPAERTGSVVPNDLPQHARILLVEDHDVNRMLVSEMLERCGQRVAMAHDGNEAISMVIDGLVRDRPFDLILMDVQMPNCDGYQATRAIREEGIGPDALPIIALTANAFPEDVAAARQAGMQGHLAKPLEFAALARALGRWLPTRIVEAPMDRDVPATCEDPQDDEGVQAYASRSRDQLRSAWLKRRRETVEAVREGLANGLISYVKKRRAQDRHDRETLVRQIHMLAGTAASFGEAKLGEQAAKLERAMAEKDTGDLCEDVAFELLALADEPVEEPAFS